MRFTVPALPAFRRALAKMVADAAAEPGADGRPSIFPQFSVETPMPKCKPPRPPCGGPTEMAPVARAEPRIVPPPYNRDGVSPCGVCGQAKRIEMLCDVRGCPWSCERDTSWIGPQHRSDLALHAAVPAVTKFTVQIASPDGTILDLGQGVSAADVEIRCDRPLADYAPHAPAEPGPSPAFDPVRAWAECTLAWMRCAYVTAEIPVQLALHHRVSVGL